MPSIRFTDRTRKSGIRFDHFNDLRNSLLPEDIGSGAGWGDYDNDGDEDLFLVNFSGGLLSDKNPRTPYSGNRLFRNDGDATFSDVTQSAGLMQEDWNTGCLWFDYDGDGRLDLAVSHFTGIRLYRNHSSGRFVDVTAQAGLEKIEKFLMGMCAADYDRDGDLDLYVCGYVKFDLQAAADRPLVAGRPASWTNPVSFPAESNLLLQNNNGAFLNVSEQAGVADPTGKSMQAVFCDLNNDGFPDLYVANDVSTDDSLFINRGNGQFENVAGLAGVMDYRAGMGIAVADIWHRGWLDLLVTHWVAEDHALWQNISGQFQNPKSPLFDDVAPEFGLAPKPSALVGWGCGLFDFNNDGYTDLLLVNGSTIEDELTEEVLREPKLIPQASTVYSWSPLRNQFVELGHRAGAYFKRRLVGRAAAFCDYDQDGRVDVVIIHNGGPAVLLRNESPAGHWLQVQASGLEKNRFAVGARVRIKAGSRIQMREILCGCSYLGNNSLIAHFGLGAHERVDWVEVQFPGGKTIRRTDVKSNQRIVISET